ncbi:hypothetical protein jhhlp_003368 [Lomentospora prolificans]|uniref:Uncharacterized protein n=1 Tax=Lomentospora prolificans TaxID=41688 RepID=A0A2N3NGN7_9PEZI|nr:hypothetical protein jhhlp_003368 [Lomentospora prolificans]
MGRQWGVVIDAGSSGTRVYVYKWEERATITGSLPQVMLEEVRKVHPGISSYVDNKADVGPNHLQALLDAANDAIPRDDRPHTPIFLMATAGMRMVAEAQQRDLLQEICNYILESSHFYLGNCETHVRTITGETEGVYGWLAANYLLGGLNHDTDGTRNDSRDTYGFLDMGGASAQIVYAPNSTETENHADDLKLIRLRNLDGTPREYTVFSASFLGFGANVARQRYVDSLKEQYMTDGTRELPDPCMPKGLRTNIEGNPLTTTRSGIDGDVLVGTGDFPQCLRMTLPLLGKETVCENIPCLFDGKHAPAIDFQVNRFVGISEYWHLTHGVFKIPGSATYNLLSYQESVIEFCSRDWSDIINDIMPRKKDPSEKLRSAQEACFKASWLINILHEGIGIPRARLDPIPLPLLNSSQELEKEAWGVGLGDAFKAVNKINGVELSWTLGHILLYACSRIRPALDNLPIGFGTNIAAVPPDFEFAALPALDNAATEEQPPPLGNNFSESHMHPLALFFIFCLLTLVLASLVLYRRDRRARIYGRFNSMLRRYRRRCSPKVIGGILPFARKLFGDGHEVYERILEEGSTFEHSLSELDGDDLDDFASPRAAISSGVLTPKSTTERFDESRASTLLGRSGLVARNESMERLASPGLMLGMGRRSRAGSPTRGKTSPMFGMQDE